VSDLEGRLPLLRQAFNPGRAQFEQPGQGGNPLELEREYRAQLGITIADYSLLAQGPLHPREHYNVSTGPVVARFSNAYFWSRDGFYLHTIINRSVPQLSMNFLADPSLIPALAGTGVAAASSITGVVSTVANIFGDAAAGGGFAFNLVQAEKYQPDPIQWLPPNRVLVLGVNVANTALNVLLEVSQPRTP
jgi:hypothetical protein